MISGMFHKIHELACMVEGTGEKIRYVLYDMLYDHEETRFVASSFSRYGMNENVKERRKTHTRTRAHTQRAT